MVDVLGDHDTNFDRERLVRLSKLQEIVANVKTRTSTRAAAELFDSLEDEEDWTSLPSRIGRLCRRLEAWVRMLFAGEGVLVRFLSRVPSLLPLPFFHSILLLFAFSIVSSPSVSS